jgi:hypothetical protein
MIENAQVLQEPDLGLLQFTGTIVFAINVTAGSSVALRHMRWARELDAYVERVS